MKVTRTAHLLAIAAIAAVAAGCGAEEPDAQASTFPEDGKEITAIVPFDPGGGMDLGMRILAQDLEDQLGVPVPVVNVTGASGQVALTQLVNEAEPDGHTILIMSMPTMPMTYLNPEFAAPYGREDLQAVAGWAAEPFTLVVGADSPYASLEDLVEDARARPGEITIGVSTLGSALFGLLLLEEAADVEFSFTNFESTPETATGVLGGHVQAGIAAVGGLSPQLKAGELRSLGVMDSERHELLSDVPTMEEQGYPVHVVGDYFIIAPAGTPSDVVETLSEAIEKATENPATRSKVEDMGQVIRYRNTSEIEAYWDEQDPKTKELVDLVAERTE